MTWPTLEVEQDDALGLAPARPAGGLSFLGRGSLKLEQRPQAEAQEARAADPQQIAACQTQVTVAQVLTRLARDNDHRKTPAKHKILESTIEQKRRAIDQGPGDVLSAGQPRVYHLLRAHLHVLAQLGQLR